jgi:hypothetical protein
MFLSYAYGIWQIVAALFPHTNSAHLSEHRQINTVDAQGGAGDKACAPLLLFDWHYRYLEKRGDPCPT